MRRSQATPEPRSIGPVKPQSSASLALTTPISTVRCLKMRFSVSRRSMSSTSVGKRLAERQDVVGQAGRHVLMHAARPEIVGMQPRAGDALVELHQPLALLEPPQERRHRADIEGEGADVEEMVEDAGDLGEQHADVLRARRRLDAQQLFDRQREGVLLAHRRDVVEPVEIGDRLEIGLVFDQLLGAAVQQADMRVGALDHFAVHLRARGAARRAPPDAAARNSW